MSTTRCCCCRRRCTSPPASSPSSHHFTPARLLRSSACSVEKVKAAIVPALQEKKLADYKKTLPAKPISEGLLKWVKKNAWEKD